MPLNLTPLRQRGTIVDTRRLFYFVRVVDSGAISRAANFLHMAQPALSQHMSALEQELGEQLLDRSRRGVTPTDAGKVLYRAALGILRIEETARQNIVTKGNSPSGYVSVGLGTYCGGNRAGVEVLREAQKSYPNISIHFVENLSVIFSEAVKMGLLDAAVIYYPGPIPGVRFEQCKPEELHLVASREAIVAEPGADHVTLAEVGALELFLPPAHHVLRRIVEAGFRDADLELVVHAEIEPSLALIQAVRENLGVTCMPWSVAREMFPGDEFQTLRIVEPTLYTRLALCTPKDPPSSEAAEAVISLLREKMTHAETDDMPVLDNPLGVN